MAWAFAQKTSRAFFAVLLVVLLSFGFTQHAFAQADGIDFSNTTGPTNQSSSNDVIAGIGITLGSCGLIGPACLALFAVIGILGVVLLLFVYFLFNLLQFLVWVLIQFAAYNDFVNSSAVTLGWVLVRDVVNMFFIVVLLIIAFSTIIRYKPFHYKDHLPKLLLMAVLINFSRTLVGLMIDFSQVVTLTFVNGFAQAASGNFMRAFGASGLLQAAKAARGIGDLGSTFIAEVFALIILVIACTTLTILVLYFLVRIVSLWILLILSPLAFFGTALPSKMQGAMSSLTKTWWSELAGWLTGGPIVAFFLWLSLAVVQQGTNEFTTIVGSVSPDESAQNAITTTEIGRPENFGLLIVSVVLMLTGVKTAVSTAQSSGNALLGKAAGQLRAGYGPAGFIARVAGRAGRRFVTGVGATNAVLQGQVDQNKMFARYAAKVPVVGSLAATGLIAASNKMRGVQGEIGKAAQKRVEGKISNLGTAEQLVALDQMKSGKFTFVDTKAAIDRKGVQIATTKDGQKVISDEEEAKINLRNTTGSLGMSGAQVKAMAAEASKNRLADILATGKESAKNSGDKDLIKEIDEVYKKNPALHADPKEVAKAINGLENDRTLEGGALQDLMVAAAFLDKHKQVDSSGALVGTEQQIMSVEPIKKFIDLGGDRATYLKAAIQDFTGSEDGKKRLEALVGSLRGGTAPTYRDTSGNEHSARLFMSKSGDGKQVLFSHTDETPEARRPLDVGGLLTGRIRLSTDTEVHQNLTGAQQAAAQSAYRDLGLRPEQFTAPLNAEQGRLLDNLRTIYAAPVAVGGYSAGNRDDMANAQVKGLLSSVAFKYNSAAKTFNSAQDEAAAQQVYDDMIAKIASANANEQNSAVSFVANTDVDEVAKGGEMRDVVAKAFNRAPIDQIKKLFAEARTDEQLKQLKQLLKVLARQAEEVKRNGARTPGETELLDFRAKLNIKELRKLVGEEKNP